MPEIDHSKNIIEVSNVSFSYDGSEDALKDITIGIHEGDYLGLLGPNGSGKTTLLKIILGLLKPASGSVRLFGQDIKKFNQWSKIGYVPQKATNFDPHFPCSVQEVVMMGRYAKRGLFRFTTAEDRKIVKRALETVDMWEYRDRLIGNLSGGQQQRIFIARALVTEPRVILLDEPTTGIDLETREQFYELLKKLNKESGLTLVLVSHDFDLVSHQVMHIAYIERILTYFGPPEKFHIEQNSIHVHYHKN